MTKTEIENTIRKAAFYAEIARTELDRLQKHVPELDWQIKVAENQMEEAIRLTLELPDALNSERRQSLMISDEITDAREICQNCEFYRGPSKSVMACHRKPPVDDFKWPKVHYTDWCAEFRQKRIPGEL